MKAIELRKEIKKRKPDFRRQDSHKKKRLSRTGYRKSRGLQSKVRLNKRGYVKKANLGYGSPKEAKNLHPAGLVPFLVANVQMLESIDATKEGVIISGNVGMKNKVEIVKKALELKLTLLNVKDPKSFIENVDSLVKERKEKRKEIKKKQQKKEEKKKENEKKKQKESKDSEKDKSDEKSIEDTLPKDVDEKKVEENKEKNKILTKKD